MPRHPKQTQTAKALELPRGGAIPDDQPVPRRGEICPPARLQGVALEIFNEIVAEASHFRPLLIYPCDAQLLARYAETRAEYEELVAWKDKFIKEAKSRGSSPSLTYSIRAKDSKRIIAVAEMPQEKIIRRLAAELTMYEKQLGLNPIARAKFRAKHVLRIPQDAPPSSPSRSEKPDYWTGGGAVAGRIGPKRA